MQPFTLNQFKYLMKRIVSLNKYIPLLFLFALAFMQEAKGQNFTSQPSSQIICEGNNVSFSVAFTGGIGTTYQWRVDDGTGFADVTNGGVYSGATSTTLTITNPPLGFDSYQYRCIASYFLGIGGDGDPATATSATAILNIDELPNPIITITGNGGSDQLCGADIALLGSDFNVQTNSSIVGLWEFTAGGGSFAPNNDETTTATLNKGVNTITWKVTNGVCATQTSPSVDITSDRNPDAAFAGSSQAFCETDNTTLNATIPKAGDVILWTASATSGPGTVTNVNSATSAVTSLGYGDNVFELVILSEYEICNPSDASYVTITRDEPPTPSIAQSNQTLCLSAVANTIDLDGGKLPGTATGQWTVGTATPTTSSNASETFTDLDQGDNIFTWTLSNGTCVGDPSYATTVTITRDVPVNQADVEITSPGDNSNFCEEEMITLNVKTLGGVNETGTWTSNKAGSFSTVNTTTYTSPAIIEGSQVFTWTVRSEFNVCAPKEDDITLIGDAKPNFTNIISPADGDEICSDNTALKAGNPGSDGISFGTWTIVGAGSPEIEAATMNLHNSKARQLDPNETYTIRWTVNNGTSCDGNPDFFQEIDIDVVDITQPQIADGSGSFVVCAGVNETFNGVVLKGNEAHNWQLYQDDGVTPVGGVVATQNFLFNELTPGDYILEYKITDPDFTCDAIATADITVNAPPTEPTGSDPAPFCLNDVTTVNISIGNNGFAGSWSVDDGGAALTAAATNPIQNNLDFSALPEGTYNYTWTPDEVLGCEGVQPTKTIVVTFDEITTASFGNGGPYEFCATSGTLAADALEGDDVGLWTEVVGLGSVTFTGSPTSAVTGLVDGDPLQLQWTVSDGVCSALPASPATTTVTNVGNLTVPNPGTYEAFCANTLTIEGAQPAADETGTWTLTDPNGDPVVVPNATNYQTTLTGLTIPGDYTLTWEILDNTGKCTDNELSTTITRLENFSGASITNAILDTCINSVITLDGNEPNGGAQLESGLWQVVSEPALATVSFNDSTLYNTTASGFTESGSYILIWTVSRSTAECAETQTVQKTINVFTPTSPLIDDIAPGLAICGDDITFEGGDFAGHETSRWKILDDTDAEVTTSNNKDDNYTFANNEEGDFKLRYIIETQGCGLDSTTTDFTRFVQPTANAGTASESICENELPYALNATLGMANVGIGTWSIDVGSPTYNPDANTGSASISNLDPGNYTLTWTVNNGGCIASNNRTLEIEAGVGANIQNTAANICISDGTITINADELKGAETGLFTIENGTAVTFNSLTEDTIAVYDIVDTGEVTIKWAVEDLTATGCSNSAFATYTFNVRPELNTPTAVDPAPICFTDGVSEVLISANLNGDVIGEQNMTGSWSSQGFTEAVENGTDLRISDLTPGTYTYTWTSTNGACPDKATTPAITVQVDELSGVVDAGGTDSVICQQPFTLYAQDPAPDNGVWSVKLGSNGNIVGDNTLTNATVEGLIANTQSTLVWTVTQGSCSAESEINLTLRDPITPPNIADTLIITCTGTASLVNDVAVDPLNGESGQWMELPPNGNISFLDSTNANTDVTASDFGNYYLYWIVKNECDSLADSLLFSYHDNPGIGADVADNICADTYDINAYQPNEANGETGIWDIDFEGSDITNDLETFAFGTKTDKDITINTDRVGTYTATWTVTNACGSQTQVFIINKYNGVSSAEAGPNQIVCTDNTVMAATPVQAGETGKWTKLSGNGAIAFADSNNPNAPVTGLTQGGTVVFEWSVSNPSAECGTTSKEVSIYYANPVNTPVSAGSNQQLCVNNTLLNATQPTYNNGESGKWTVESAPGLVTFTDDTLYNTFVTIDGTAGTYQLKWTITNACGSDSSIVDIFRFSDNINVTNSAETGDSITICTTEYELNGNAPTEGEGVWEYVSGPGNIVAGEENLTNATVEDITETQPTIVRWVLRKGTCAEDSEEFKITKSGDITTPQVGPGQEICADTTSLVATNLALAEEEEGTWSVTNSPAGAPSVVFSPDANDFNPLVSNLVFGTYEFTWTISNGVCPDATATVNVTYYETPANAIADLALRDTVTMCDDELLLTLDANEPVIAGATGAWTNGDGIVFDDAADAKSSITGPIAQGDYTLTWTLTNGVCSSVPDNVVLSVLQALTEPTASAPAEICADSVQLTANAADTTNNETGTWSVTSLNDVSGIVFAPNANDPNAIASNLTFGDYTFAWTISNGGKCDDKKASTVVSYLETPGQGDAGADIEICIVDDAPQLSASPLVLPNQGTWSDVSGTLTFTDDVAGTIPNANNPDAYVQDWAVGTYQIIWSVANSSCVAPNDTVLLTVYNSPDVADADEFDNTITEICLNETIDLNALAPGANKGTGVWTSDDAGNTVFSNANFDTTQVGFLAAGNYRLTWTITNGPCAATSDFIDITVNPLPVTPNAGVNDTICADEYIGQLAGNDPQGYAAAWVQAAEDTDVVTITPTGALTADLTNIGYGDHHLIWEITTPTCGILRDTVIIRRSEDPVADSNGNFAGPDQELCFNETNFAAELLVGIGTWTKDDIGAAGIIADINDPSSFLSDLDRGITAFNWTVSNEACGPYVDQVLITVNDYPEPDAANNDEDNFVELCETFEFDLNATQPDPPTLTPLWRVISPSTHTVIFDDNTLYNTHVSGLDYGLTRIGWSLDNGECKVEDTLEVMVYNAPTIADINVDNVTTCDTIYQFNADPPLFGTGLWTKDFGPAGAIIEKPTKAATKMLNLVPGDYQFRWTISNGNCPSSTDAVALTVKEIPVSDAGVDSSLCEDVTTTIDLYANTPVVGQVGTWTKLLGTGIIDDVLDPATEVTNLSLGANIFVWTVDNGTCATPDTVIITLYDSPSNAVVGANKETCESSETLFAGNVTVGQGKWTLQSGQGIISNPFSKTPTVSDLGVGVNEFAWTVTSGPCTPTVAVQTITRYAKPEPIELGADLFICADTLQLTTDSTSAGVGTWEMVTGVGAFDDENDENTTVRGLQDGLSRISWTINTLKCGFTTDTLTVEVQPRTTVPQTMADFTVCESNVTITANEILQGVGHWESVNTSAIITDETNDTTDVNNLIFGDNTFVWVVENAPCAVLYDTLIVTRLVPPHTANAGDDQAICDDNTVLDGNNDSTAIGVWTVVAGFGTFADENLYNTAVTDIPDGYHTYAWTLSKGDCPITSDTVEVFVNERTSLVYAGADQESCLDSALLMATPVTQGVGHWEKVNTTATIADVNNDTTMVYNLAYGDNHLVWVVENEPCEPIRDTVILTRSQPVEMANAGPDQQLCETSTIIAADEVFIGIGHWEVLQGGGVLGNSLDFNTTVTGLSRVQDNILIWKVENASCAASVDTLIIVVDQIPTTADAGTNETVCSTSYNLDGNVPTIGNGTWRVISGSGTFVDSTDAKTQVNNLAPGDNEFSWTITNGTCDSTFATVVITRDEEPSAAIVEDDFNVCDTVAVINAVQPLVGEGVWVAFSPGRTIDDNTALTTGVNNLEFGSNRFGWIVRNGICPIKTAIVDVFRNMPADMANAGDDIEVCGTSVMLNAQALSIGEGYWTDPAGNAMFNDSTLINATASNLANNINQLVWSTTNGACIGNSDTVQVTALPIPIIDLGDDISLCDTFEVSITASALEPLETGTWRLLSGSGVIDDVNSENITVTNLGVGENTFEWYVENTIGCNNSDTIVITVFELPSAANINVVDDVCETDVLAMTAESPLIGTGTWSTSTSGLSFDDVMSASTSITLTTYGPQEVTYTIVNGSCPASVASTIFNRFETPSAAEVMDNDTVCGSDRALTATPPTVGVGNWSLVAGTASLDNANSPNAHARNMGEGANVFKYEVTNGNCPPSEAQVTIVKLADLTVPSILSVDDICEDDFELSANAPKTGEQGSWSVISGSLTMSDFNDSVTAASAITPETFEVAWTISNAKCELTDTQEINFYGTTPDANAGEDLLVCDAELVLAGVAPSKGSGEWNIVNGQGLFDDDNDPITRVSAIDTGITALTWTVGLGTCPTKTDTVLVSYELGPEIILAPIFETRAGVAVQLTAEVIDAIVVTWTPPTGLSNTKTEITAATVFETTSYTITAVDQNGCQVSETTTVLISDLDPDEIVQINLFSPNGDGVNDYWTINQESMALGCQVEIYDRYGVVVFQASNYANEWDGTKGGEQLPEGTYYYSISCGNNTPEQGAITLLR